MVISTISFLISVPSAPPQNVSITSLSSSSLKVSWSNVPLEYRNGEITGYVVIFHDVLESTSENITIHNQSQFVFVKDSLRKYHNYSVRVAAKTSVGLGKYSSWIETKTLEDSKEKLSLFFPVVVFLVFAVEAVVVVVSVLAIAAVISN